MRSDDSRLAEFVHCVHKSQKTRWIVRDWWLLWDQYLSTGGWSSSMSTLSCRRSSSNNVEMYHTQLNYYGKMDRWSDTASATSTGRAAEDTGGSAQVWCYRVDPTNWPAQNRRRGSQHGISSSDFRALLIGVPPVYVKYNLVCLLLPYLTLLCITCLFSEETYRPPFLTDLQAQWLLWRGLMQWSALRLGSKL